jgi:hypothetical protein
MDPALESAEICYFSLSLGFPVECYSGISLLLFVLACACFVFVLVRLRLRLLFFFLLFGSVRVLGSWVGVR